MRLWPVVLATGLGLAILLSLGTWQVFRLAEKNRQVIQLQQRFAAAPVTLGEALTRADQGEDIEYLKVKVEGLVEPSHTLKKLSTRRGMPAFELIRPLATPDGNFILIDDGLAYEPDGKPGDATEKSFVGILRAHNKGRGYFDGDNDVAGNLWTWWDIPAMVKAAGHGGRFVRYVVQRLPDSDGMVEPYALLPEVELTNNHLTYAITWFSLAAALAGVAGLFILQRRRKTEP